MTTIADRRQILGELERLGKADLAKLWRLAEGADDFRSLMVEAFPELVLQYGSMAADLAAVWYDESAPDLPYRARVADPPDVARFAESASWALDTGSGMDALDLMGGTFQRGMWDMSRGTTIENVGAEAGALWARHASANACEFCRMLATRGAVYASESSASKVGGRGKDASTSFDAMGKRKRGGLAKGVRTRGNQSIGSKYHDHCVPGMTLVSGPGVEGAYRRRFEGEVVVIKTAAGNELTITPNHPVLTDDGWVDAGLLREGGYVVRSLSADARPVSPHEHQRPSLIQDVWGALRVHGLARVPGSAEDFHGDGSDGEVEIVGAYGLLLDRVNAAGGQEFEKFKLSDAGGGRTPATLPGCGDLAPLFEGADPASRRTIRGAGEVGPLIRIQSGQSNGASIPAGPDFDSELQKATPNDVTGHAELIGDGQFGLTFVDVHMPHGFGGDGEPIPRRFDPSSAQLVVDGVSADSSAGRCLLDGLAGQVELDRIIELRRVGFSGHVFNLQTTEGWYSADGLIVSNCHCVAVEVRPGQSYEPPPYVADWEAEYIEASKIANQEHRMSGGSNPIDLAGYGAGDTKSILREMRNARKG